MAASSTFFILLGGAAVHCGAEAIFPPFFSQLDSTRLDLPPLSPVPCCAKSVRLAFSLRLCARCSLLEPRYTLFPERIVTVQFRSM